MCAIGIRSWRSISALPKLPADSSRLPDSDTRTRHFDCARVVFHDVTRCARPCGGAQRECQNVSALPIQSDGNLPSTDGSPPFSTAQGLGRHSITLHAISFLCADDKIGASRCRPDDNLAVRFLPPL